MNAATPAGKTVLIVEDQEAEREDLATTLSRAGHVVLVAPSAQAALDYLQCSPRPDLILLDMLMEGLDGWDFLQVRRHAPVLASIPVVLMTRSSTVTEQLAKALGAAAFLPKPLGNDLLLEAVRCVCG
jgi:CheY-like chemotaxis protein